MSFDWRRASSEEVEKHYNPSVAVGADALQGYVAQYDADSTAARKQHPTKLGETDLLYGDTPRQAVDLHRPEKPSGALVMFIHGGYWRRFAKTDFDFVVPGFLKAGVTLANVDYDLCPDVTLDEIVAQMKRCLLYVADRAEAWGCDPKRFYLAGHSAGAHLVATLLRDPVCCARVAGAHLMSGIYEVPVVRRVSVNEVVGLDEAAAARNDVSKSPPARPVPLVVSFGGNETGPWKTESLNYAALAKAGGCTVEVVECVGKDHFSMPYDCCTVGCKAFEAFQRLIVVTPVATAARL